jgi:hypothetical protein
MLASDVAIVAEITGSLSRGLIGFAAAKLTDERWVKGFLVEPQAVDIWSCGGWCAFATRANFFAILGRGNGAQSPSALAAPHVYFLTKKLNTSSATEAMRAAG